MQIIDQNSAKKSLEQSLLPSSAIIDSRTEKDWLKFLSGFSALINFYDQDNNVNGTWTPFLLKDPLFLTAAIAGTPFYNYHSLYTATVKKLTEALNNIKAQGHDVAFLFNRLFDHLTNIFIHIKNWIHYMYGSDDNYTLKNYTINQATITISPYFWALNSLRQNLYLSAIIPGITPVDSSRFPKYSVYEEKLWKQNKDRVPYWEVLGLEYPISNNTPQNILNAITAAGDTVFQFFQTVIHHAHTEFDKIKTETVSYPDTVLLRSFIELLKIHQQQLNTITGKHLSFYYQNILKQNTKEALPDSAYVYLTLSKKSSFTLPEGTLFNAGNDANKQPILFAITKNSALNPAVITGAYTLSVLPANNSLNTIYLRKIQNPTSIQKDEDGVVQPWETFGGSAWPGAAVTNGFAFASPLLLLKEGYRKVVFVFEFSEECDLRLLKNAKYYLSTKEEWLEVTAHVQFPDYCDKGQRLSIEMLLDDTFSPIEAFINNPDGFKSNWPMLKLVFEQITNPANPPIVTALNISVTVTGVKTFTLYNDYGQLSTKNPYPPFGPAPLYNSNFIIGSNEIFSKPVNTVYFELDWSKLPDDGFNAYYNEYNNYITKYDKTVSDDTKKINDEGNLKPSTEKPQENRSLYLRVIDGIFQKSKTGKNSKDTFNNCRFTVNFQQLRNNAWKNIDVDKLQDITISDNYSIATTPYTHPAECELSAADANKLLFNALSKNKLEASSYFSYTFQDTLPVDTAIQNIIPFQYKDNSTDGFIRMVLTGPEKYGFGSQLYPKVVTDIALQNATIIIEKKTDYKPAANIPFVPNLTNFIGHYTANQSYNFDSTSNNQPIECFLYTPFSNYKVYDNIDKAISDTADNTNIAGISLFTPLGYNGSLFLELDNVAISNMLSLYAELAVNYGKIESQQVDYYYLANTGWKNLPLLDDSTNNFSCPGIITVNLPDDMCNTSILMPAEKYYIALNVKHDALLYGKTLAITTNGISVTRVINTNDTVIGIPQIAANTITKTQFAVPQIASVSQPFPSFGGRAAEDEELRNIRVSNRIKTKDRVSCNEDYYRIIQQEFPSIYYNKPIYDSDSSVTTLYVVNSYSSITEANALLPMVSTCQQNKIEIFLSERISAFTTINISNFDFQYIKINASVIINDGFEGIAIQKAINKAISIFISPWILSTTPQVIIDQTITDSQIANCILGIPGVLEVQTISFTTWTDANNSPIGPFQSVSPLAATMLMVSAGNHQIEFN